MYSCVAGRYISSVPTSSAPTLYVKSCQRRTARGGHSTSYIGFLDASLYMQAELPPTLVESPKKPRPFSLGVAQT